MIKKFAKVNVIASGNSINDVLPALKKTASFYAQESESERTEKIDIQAILNEIFDEYKISKNPNDYYYVAVRANSVNIPNENGDAFSKEELQRFDHHLARRVYQTYIAKPIHVNHRSDNSRMARGVIFDAHYHDTLPLDEAKKGAIKQAYGVNLDNDEFVEVLIGLDKTKDPHLAEGIRKGLLDSFSMGCECEATRCSVCDHIAHTKLEFCKHIKSGKMKPFTRDDGIKVKAFEWCEGVVFNELSSVDQPADPEALTREVLDIRGKIASLEYSTISNEEIIENQSQLLILQARLRKLEETMGGFIMSKTAQVVPSSTPVMKPTEEDPMIKEQEDQEDDIGEFRIEKEEQEKKEGPMSSDEIGIKAYAYAKTYQDYKARQTKEAVLIIDPKGNVLMDIKQARQNKPISAVEILRNIASEGLSMTAKKYKAYVKNSQGGVTDYAVQDKDTKVLDEKIVQPQSVKDMSDTNMKDDRGEEDKGTVSGVGEVTDKKEEHELRSPVVGKKAQEAKPFEGKETPEEEALEHKKEGVTPEGFEDVVLELKKDPKITNPWAVAWWMKSQGYKPGGKKGQVSPMAPTMTAPPPVAPIAAIEDEDIKTWVKKWEDAGKPEPKEAQDAGEMPMMAKEEVKPFEGKETPEEEKLEEEILEKKEMYASKKKAQSAFNVGDSVYFTHPSSGLEIDGVVAQVGYKSYTVKVAHDYPRVDLMAGDIVLVKEEGGDLFFDRRASKKAQQKEVPTDSGALQGAETSMRDDAPHRNEDTLSVQDAMDSDKREKQPKKEVTDAIQEDAIRDHVEKLEARLKTLYKNKQAKAIKDFQEAFSARFIRAAKLAIKREALNLESSMIKSAMADSLMMPLKLGSDEVLPLDAQATVALIERAITPSLMTSYIDNLLSRSAKLMKMSDESIMQLEKDIDTLQAVEPPMDEEKKDEEDLEEKEAKLRYRASKGNLVFAPSSSESVISNNHGFDKRSSIREAMGGTIVSNIAHGMSRAVLKTQEN